jgi:hypothetical protein
VQLDSSHQPSLSRSGLNLIGTEARAESDFTQSEYGTETPSSKFGPSEGRWISDPPSPINGSAVSESPTILCVRGYGLRPNRGTASNPHFLVHSIVVGTGSCTPTVMKLCSLRTADEMQRPSELGFLTDSQFKLPRIGNNREVCNAMSSTEK